jgi:hypothetical protein
MSEIRKSNGICTQINVVRLPVDNQDEVLKLMIERARFMATQPGFVSVNLHRSKDGSHVVNYVQWSSPTSSPPRTTRLSSARNGRASVNW